MTGVAADTGGQAQQMARALQAWAAIMGRRPPWRALTAIYPLAVAEVLLQKTRGHDAIPVWSALMAAFPNVTSLAAAPDTAIHALVAPLGLGRQRTARLKTLASALAANPPPARLPALGPYGAAILALAMGTQPPVAPVDGNIARVITRVYGLAFARGEPRKKPEVRAATAALLDTEAAPAAKLGLAYALVDLGATICTPARPACPDCPLLPWCATAPNRPGR